MLALLDHHLLDLAGPYGDPEAGEPIQYDEVTVVAGVGRGEVFLARRNGREVGTLTITWSDPMIWHDRSQDPAYAHRLAIRRAFGG